MARPPKGTTFWQRVWASTRYSGDCHEFFGCRDSCGYGRIHRDGKLVRIHREVWKRENGEIPNGMVVCHRCDNPACINADHLFIGTQKDNMRDMWDKNRATICFGERNGTAKLKNEDIPVIRRRISNGETCYAIARDYSVTGECILAIKNNHRWVNF